MGTACCCPGWQACLRFFEHEDSLSAVARSPRRSLRRPRLVLLCHTPISPPLTLTLESYRVPPSCCPARPASATSGPGALSRQGADGHMVPSLGAEGSRGRGDAVEPSGWAGNRLLFVEQGFWRLHVSLSHLIRPPWSWVSEVNGTRQPGACGAPRGVGQYAWWAGLGWVLLDPFRP